MSSRREVLIRILVLLQRKKLIGTKNRTLKWHHWTVRSRKNVALLTEDGAFALFFLPHPGGFASSRVPTQAKKMLIPGGQPGGGGRLGADGIDWCITWWLSGAASRLVSLSNFYCIWCFLLLLLFGGGGSWSRVLFMPSLYARLWDFRQWSDL